MKLFEGKTKSERNKTIAAIVLGAACLIVLLYAFGLFSRKSSTTASAKPTPTPKATSAARSNPGKVEMPTVDEQTFVGETTPIAYNRSFFHAPDPGRNIFAFYEPGKPTPYIPTPFPIKATPIPTAAPTPPIQLAVINPGSVFAGSNGFKLDIAGDNFTPDTKIYWEQQELPASFISPTRMTADIPSVLIRSDGRRQVMAQTADGTKISNPLLFDIQPPPKPQFQYIGMIARKRSNNDTAYFQEANKPLPTGARLNDVVGGRFRVISISAAETVLEDVNLGFKHKLALFTPPPGTAAASPGPGTQPGRFPGGRNDPAYQQPMNPNPNMPPNAPSRIPGIPDNIPRYVPPSNSNRMPVNSKQDVDDDDDGR